MRLAMLAALAAAPWVQPASGATYINYPPGAQQATLGCVSDVAPRTMSLNFRSLCHQHRIALAHIAKAGAEPADGLA